MLSIGVTFLVMSAQLIGVTATGCSEAMVEAGMCTEIVNTGSQVDLAAGETIPGGSSGTENPGGADVPPADTPTPAPPEPCSSLFPDRCGHIIEVALPPDVTIDDLASFRPAAPTAGGEPAGFGVVGLPTNLVAEASEQVIAGSLLGWDVRVRFVPAGFVFDNGDGTTTPSRSGGASWAALGQTQFSPTATSHVYRARGVYTASATVQYSASVDFGSGSWRPVAGFVTARSAGYDIRVVEASTALVDRTCREDPRGPGC